MLESGETIEEQQVGMPPHNFSFFVAVCFTLNYIIGSGFLTLPWAFYETGWLLGLLLLCLVTFVSILASWFILEAMARAEMLANNLQCSATSIPIADDDDDDKLGHSQRSIELGVTALNNSNNNNPIYHTISPLSGSSEHSLLGERSLTLRPTTRAQHSSTSSREGDNLTIVGNRKFEIPELCEIFLGEKGRQCYTCIIAVYMYGTLWAYSTVFANAFTAQFPLSASTHTNNPSYVTYLVLFAVLVVPASLMELSEQITVQVTLSACRVAMLAAMVLTIAIAHTTDTSAFGSIGETKNEAILANPAKIYILLPIAAYANIFHHSIPSLSNPVQNKSSLGKVFTTALVISLIAYASIGSAISVYFGEHTKIASNLNWKSYTGIDTNGAQGAAIVPLSASLTASFIVLFPAIDVASAFPLNAITLGNNLMAATYGTAGVVRIERSRMHRWGFRLLAALPPILLALVQSNLGTITDFTGLTGFSVAFIFPACLSIFSERKLASMGLETKTLYSSEWTRRRWAVLTMGVGAFLVLFVGLSLATIGPAHGPTRR